jgi:uncharacterized surface protein with fasciclin (FAS1) repeats
MTEAGNKIAGAAGDLLQKAKREPRFTGSLEATLLILVGLIAGWFASGEDYSLLMNPRFRWLTLFGALVVFAMGATAFIRSRRAGLGGLAAFLLLGGIVLLGKPLSENSASSLITPKRLSGAQMIEDKNFPSMDMRDIQAAVEEQGRATDGMAFSALGKIHHIPTRDGKKQVVLMRSYMVCCVADAYAVGFRLTGNGLEALKGGEWMVVSGRVAALPETDPVLPFRMGTATFPTVNDQYVIEAAKIVPYTATLPTLLERLSSESTAGFARALQSTGLWEMLKDDGPFTVFAPINEAFDNSAQGSIKVAGADQNRTELKAWLSRHIVSGRYTTPDLFDQSTLKTIHGRPLHIRLDNGRLFLENSRLLFKNIIARNGVVHIIYPALKDAQ